MGGGLVFYIKQTITYNALDSLRNTNKYITSIRHGVVETFCSLERLLV